MRLRGVEAEVMVFLHLDGGRSAQRRHQSRLVRGVHLPHEGQHGLQDVLHLKATALHAGTKERQ